VKGVTDGYRFTDW